jgi:formylglycine-generating enzyme required for sulfatase activity
MNKHISDPAPTLASMGVNASPALEQAVAHTLAKKPDQRTSSVEMFVSELQQAIHPGTAQFLHSSPGRSLPVSSLKIQTRPPKSSVFIDNVSVGETADTGTLLLEGIQSGNHHLRVSHDGFYDWLGDVVCDGKPQEIFAELRSGVAGATDSNVAIPMPTEVGMTGQGAETIANRRILDSQDAMAQTVQQTWRPDGVGVSTGGAETKKGFFSPLVLGISGLLALLLIGVVGGGAAYMLGYIGKSKPGVNSVDPTPVPTPVDIKPELIAVPGGTFKMGRDEGLDIEKPAHQVQVPSFKMDKTEVTNAEYFAFIKATSYPQVPAHWVNDKPIAGTEKMPVRFVNIEDINAFISWRSKRDGFNYRLPTEAEWEYAARNGAKDNLYPWGDTYQSKCAVLDKENTEPEPVGANSCPDDWGIVDLIGNVFEWTGTKANLYPGSKGTMKQTKETHYMIRGGAALYKSSGDFGITSTFRADVDESKRDKELGFRLVAPN